MDIKKVIEILNDTEADMEYTHEEINTAYRIAIELLEKQISKMNYCKECGQKLDWS